MDHSAPTNPMLPPVVPAGPPPPGALARWLDLIWVQLPALLWRAGSLPALAAADGTQLTAVPLLGAIVPPLAFLLGLLCGTVRFATVWSFSESLGIMALFVLVGFGAGAGPGLWMWLGYVVGDFFLYRRPDIYLTNWNPLEAFVRTRGAWFLLYVLLALILVAFPLTASALRRVTPLPWPRPSRQAALAEGGIYVAIAALLTYSWSQSVPILQRPIFTWRNDFPTVVSMSPLQQHGHWVLLAAIVAALGRSAFDLLTVNEPGAQARMARFGARLAGAERQVVSWTRVPLAARLVVGAALTTLLLAGMLPGWGDGLLLLFVLAVVYIARQYLSDLFPFWYRWLSKVPLVARLLAAALLSRLLTPLVLTPLWPYGVDTPLLLRPFQALLKPLREGNNFRPILLTTLVGLIVATMLTPPTPRPRPASAPPASPVPPPPPAPPPRTPAATPPYPLEVRR